MGVIILNNNAKNQAKDDQTYGEAKPNCVCLGPQIRGCSCKQKLQGILHKKAAALHEKL